MRLVVYVFSGFIDPSTTSQAQLRAAVSHLSHQPKAGVHAVYGLYLLSFLPLHTPRTEVDEYDGAGRGYRMGREIGLDAACVHDDESQKMVSVIDN